MRSLLALTIILVSIQSFGQALETVIQKGHELSVLTVSISPDSNLVASGSRDKSAKLWELSTGREVRSFLGHEGSINCIDFTRDGKWMITSSGDKTARIWEVATGKEIFVTTPADKFLTAAAFSPDSKHFITGGYPDEALVWDFKTLEVVKSIPVNADQGLGYGINLAFSDDGKWLAIGEDNRVANVYATTNWEKKFTFSDEGSCGGCATWVDFSSDSRFLLMASNSAPVKKYDLLTGKLLTTYTENLEDVVSTEFSPDDSQVMVVTKNEIILWDNKSGKETGRYKPVAEAEISEANYTADGNDILLACNNNIIYRWNINAKKSGLQLTGLLNQRDKGGITYDPNFYWESNIAKYIRFKNSLLLSKDGKELIKGKFGTKVKRWDIASGKVTMNYSGHEKAALCYDLSQDGKILVAGGGDGRIVFWNTETGDTIKVIKAHREPIFDIHFSHDESTVASSSWDATFKMFDVKTGARVNYYDFQNNSVYNFQFHPTDLYVFIASLDNSLKLLELDTHKPVREFVGHSDIVSSIQISPDQNQLLSTSWDGSIRLWDIATGLMTKKFMGHKGQVHTAIFSRDGKYIYSAGADRVIRAWDIATARVIRSFYGHNAEITSLLLGLDDKMLISHSLDGATKFWDLNSGNEFFEHIHFGEKEWMVKNPEGYFNGTQEARQYIHFVNGVKTYGVDQFFDEFFRPDLLPKIFQNRGNKDDYKGIQGKLYSSPPPGIKVATVPGADDSQTEVLIQITDNGGGIETLKIFHNGKSIPIDKQTLKFPARKGESTTYRHVVNLIGGTNTITALASNKDKIESNSQTIEIVSTRAGKNSVCYILSVGINQYKNSKLALNYARPDAESFGKIMDERGSLFKNIELHSLYDTEASKVNIFKKLEELSAKIHQEDVFIFYYAGHGSMVDNQFFFIPSESIRLYDLASLKKEAIEASVLQEKLKNIKALKQLIVMDACQSGASVELLATRGAAEEKAIAQLSRSAGIHVMASAGSEQFATEFAELGHGLFTYLLIKALEGDADGAPKDGKVTIYELKSYLDDQVPEMTQKLKGKPQYPYTFSRGQDFPVVIENEK